MYACVCVCIFLVQENRGKIIDSISKVLTMILFRCPQNDKNESKKVSRIFRDFS